MTTFRLLWELHKWTGLTLSLILLLSATTGLLLLLKKEFEWIQPPTASGTPGPATEIASIQEVYEAVFALGLPQLKDEADIARIDFRPGDRVFKVRSRHDDLEVQVDAIGLRTWEPGTRNSDWLERLHDGSWLGDWAHDWLMPLVSLGLIGLVFSGIAIWLWPKILKRRARAAARS